MVLPVILVALSMYCQHLQFLYSASVSIKYCLTMDIRYLLLNMMISVIPFLLILLISRNTVRSLLISSILVTVLSLINYHVFLFHGTPFLASDIYNIGTAFDVMAGYKPVFDSMVIRLLAIAFIEIIMMLIVRKMLKKNSSNIKRRVSGSVLAIDCIALWMIFFSGWTLFPNSLVSWSWAKPMAKYGYEVCFMNSIYCTNKKYNMIEGYDVEKLNKYLSEDSTAEYSDSDARPDIILILNEAFSNLNYNSGIKEAQTVLEPIDTIEGIISGHAVVPLIGGGTNCSEYELLTSNSMYEISSASPFAVLNLTDASSIVSHLKSLGYASTAMHCYSEDNYARNTAYPDLGFDNVYLGNKYFTYNKHGNREWLDRDNYLDLLEYYKNAGDSPRFMYLLTFQNHGGYEQNDASYDTVKVTSDYGSLTDDVNEYLTSMKSCAESFEYLIDQLSQSDRPVIVLMMGDHAPSFISELPVSDKGTQSSIVQRTVPYYVWSNTDLDTDVFSETATLTDLIPMLLKSAHMPLTPYYQFIYDLHLSVPIRTSDGLYYDSNGTEINLKSGSEYGDSIRDYYYMEYNNMVHGEDYIPELFRNN